VLIRLAYATSGTLFLTGLGMTAGGDWIAALPAASQVKLYGVLIAVNGALLALLIKSLNFGVSQAVETLRTIPPMQEKVAEVAAKAEQIQPWFEDLKSKAERLAILLRKLRRQLRREYQAGDKDILDRVAWLEGQHGKHGAAKGA
jgi:hypothetical protein